MASSAWSGNTAGLASATSPGLVQAGGYNVLPAGTVLPYAGSTAPTGFLFCDGSEISKTTYAQLYAAIADVYATQTDPTTGSAWAAPSALNFRIPDYRGSFLRSVGTFSDSIGTNTTLGGYQSDSIQGHMHNHIGPNGSDVASNSYWTNTGSSGSAMPNQYGASPSTPSGISFSVTSPRTDGTNGTPRTAKETRVRNKGVNYIIKY